MPRDCRPNLLFVFADQMRGMAMGCAGNPDVRTPNMDRLASEGVRLTRCFATSPVCSPNRAVMLSGTFPTTNLMLCNDFPLKPDVPSLGTVARENGYATGYVGKWHLDGVPRSKFTPPGPRRWGFDFWAAYNCSHRYFEPKYYRDDPEVVSTGGYEPEVQADLALGFLRERARDGRPFCLVLSWGPPHDPYEQVPDEFLRLYEPENLHLRPNTEPASDNPLARGKDCRLTHARYYAAVSALDRQLGRLLRCLEETHLAGDTVVVFTSDHGDMLWSHGLMKKQSPYEESISVPFIIRAPGLLPSGETRDVLMGGTDILPTLCSLLGWEVPSTVEGVDLSGFLRGDAAAPRPSSVLVANYVSADEGQAQGMPEWRGVRTERHTYVELPGRRPWLLFDNAADPFQVNNLVDSPGHSALKEELSEELGRWLERTSDPFLPPGELLRHYGLEGAYADRARMYD